MAQVKNFSLNQEMIDQEARFDGFYCICTDLAGPAAEIIRLNSGRWVVENDFRITKTDTQIVTKKKMRSIIASTKKREKETCEQ